MSLYMIFMKIVIIVRKYKNLFIDISMLDNVRLSGRHSPQNHNLRGLFGSVEGFLCKPIQHERLKKAFAQAFHIFWCRHLVILTSCCTPDKQMHHTHRQRDNGVYPVSTESLLIFCICVFLKCMNWDLSWTPAYREAQLLIGKQSQRPWIYSKIQQYAT